MYEKPANICREFDAKVLYRLRIFLAKSFRFKKFQPVMQFVVTHHMHSDQDKPAKAAMNMGNCIKFRPLVRNLLKIVLLPHDLKIFFYV